MARSRRWWSSCPVRLRHSSRASPARCTTWKGSMTAVASGSSSAAALLNPVNPSIATISIFSRHVWGWEASQVLKTCLDRPGTMSKSREGPRRSRMGVKSKMTVTYLSPYGVCRHTCSSTPMTHTPTETIRITCEYALAFSQDSGVGGSSRTRPEPGRCAPPSHDERPRPSEPSAPPPARAWRADRPLDSYLGATREHTSGHR